MLAVCCCHHDSVAPPREPTRSFLAEAGWAAWIITLLGSTSLSGFLGTLADLPQKAGLSDGAVILSAALGGLAITLGVVFAVVSLKSTRAAGHPAAMLAFGSILVGIAVANFVGIGAVGWDLVLSELSKTGGTPLEKVIALVLACVITYGPIASAQAAVAGWLLGDWAAKISGADS